MFAKRPGRLGQEEVYVALKGLRHRGSGRRAVPDDADHIVRLGPGVRRKVSAGPRRHPPPHPRCHPGRPLRRRRPAVRALSSTIGSAAASAIPASAISPASARYVMRWVSR